MPRELQNELRERILRNVDILGEYQNYMESKI